MATKAILFLDVDGVLNTHALLASMGTDFIDEGRVAILARIVRETGARVVLSSFWRVCPNDFAKVQAALSKFDIAIVGTTPVFEGWVEREVEISAWLKANHTDRFAILDDDAGAEIPGSFFKTEPEETGLTEEIGTSVIRHLNGG